MSGVTPRGLLQLQCDRTPRVHQPRPFLAHLQRARARAGRGRPRPAAGAREVPGDLLEQPRRVLHEARRAAPPAPRGPRRGREDHPRGHDARPAAARDPQAGGHAPDEAGSVLVGVDPPRARRGRHPRPPVRRPLGGRSRRDRRVVRGQRLPDPDAARGRSLAPLPVHLQPVGELWPARRQPGLFPPGVRPGQDPGGRPQVRPAVRRVGRPVRVSRPRRPDRQQPRPALPGPRDPRDHPVPRDAVGRARRRGRGRGQRDGPGGGRAAQATLRRRGSTRDPARRLGRRPRVRRQPARARRPGRLPARGPARVRRPVPHRLAAQARPARDAVAARGAPHPARPRAGRRHGQPARALSALGRFGGPERVDVCTDPRGRHPAAPPLRVVRGLGRAVRRRGRRRPRRHRDQADDLPHQPGLAVRPLAHPGRRERQERRRAGRAAGAVRRAAQRRVREAARARGRARRLRRAGPQDTLQVLARHPARARR